MKALFLIFSFLSLPLLAHAEEQKATFAGGCFWCMEPPFEKLEGVKSVISGYMGGHVENPTYKEVSAGKSGHREVVQVTFDPQKVSYSDLLQVFWRNVNPTDSGGQFVDRGHQYTTAIYFHTPAQKNVAEQSKKNMDSQGPFKKPIVTPIEKAQTFYAAEQYHQDYYKNSLIKYKYYRYRSGRDDYINETWGDKKEYKPGKVEKEDMQDLAKYRKPSKEKIKEMLNKMQFKVTQNDGTEPPFKNEYWDNKKEGIYVDIVSGEPLFSSTHKYKSGTGWPSFYQPIDKSFIVEKEDRGFFSVRTEIRSKVGDSHLGHVFSDGPEPTGLRYCMNSAAMRFVPKEKMQEEGYGEYLNLFESQPVATN